MLPDRHHQPSRNAPPPHVPAQQHLLLVQFMLLAVQRANHVGERTHETRENHGRDHQQEHAETYLCEVGRRDVAIAYSGHRCQQEVQRVYIMVELLRADEGVRRLVECHPRGRIALRVLPVVRADADGVPDAGAPVEDREHDQYDAHDACDEGQGVVAFDVRLETLHDRLELHDAEQPREAEHPGGADEAHGPRHPRELGVAAQPLPRDARDHVGGKPSPEVGRRHLARAGDEISTHVHECSEKVEDHVEEEVGVDDRNKDVQRPFRLDVEGQVHRDGIGLEQDEEQAEDHPNEAPPCFWVDHRHVHLASQHWHPDDVIPRRYVHQVREWPMPIAHLGLLDGDGVHDRLVEEHRVNDPRPRVHRLPRVAHGAHAHHRPRPITFDLRAGAFVRSLAVEGFAVEGLAVEAIAAVLNGQGRHLQRRPGLVRRAEDGFGREGHVRGRGGCCRRCRGNRRLRHRAEAGCGRRLQRLAGRDQRGLGDLQLAEA
mmetsp:Transcript_63796/g.195078  ORF Transcript_63796/g.195078 Transcript_63796/m.195078 type:complete len:487 (+) Transcript_63796:1379-2839(+)